MNHPSPLGFAPGASLLGGWKVPAILVMIACAATPCAATGKSAGLEAAFKTHVFDHVIVLEMIGYYSDREGSQSYPLPAMRQIYPSIGDFIAVVGNIPSSPSVERIKQAVVKNSKIHCQGLAGPSALKGIDFSDHLNYWALGMDAVMVTDTSFYRNPNYHKQSDTPETLDYLKMAKW